MDRNYYYEKMAKQRDAKFRTSGRTRGMTVTNHSAENRRGGWYCGLRSPRSCYR